MKEIGIQRLICLVTSLLLVPVICAGQTASQTKTSATQLSAEDALFLSEDDVRRTARLLPGLVEATQKGRDTTRSFLLAQDVSFQELTQLLSNITVAYSALKFDEYMKELQPQLEQKPGEYQRLLEESRKQLAEITARHQRAQRSGRSALQVNREIVAKNLPTVEEIVEQLREVDIAALPQR